jgi:hypothetical protein
MSDARAMPIEIVTGKPSSSFASSTPSSSRGAYVAGISRIS